MNCPATLLPFSRLPAHVLVATLAFAGFPASLKAEAPPIPRTLPPQAPALSAELADPLRQRVNALRTAIPAGDLAPDVEVFAKAVDLALVNGEFFKPGDEKKAATLLDEGEKRLAALKTKKSPWTTSTGSTVRGFRSAIDGSVQPYGVEVPASATGTKKVPLYVWLHGRGDTDTDMHFMAGRLKGKGQFQSQDAIIIHPFGRHCLGFKSAGEIDVLEAVEHACSHYPVDRNKIALMGFSMGGAGAWHIGAHYTERWAVVHAGAGFVDVRRYQKADPAALPPWEVTLWGAYDVPDYCRNFFNVPLIAYSGEIDPQKASADIMEEELKKEGYELKRVIGKQMGHKYSPEGLKEVQQFIDASLAKAPLPAEDIHFQTRTLRYHTMKWLDVLGLGEHWQDARVDGGLKAGVVTLATKNVTALNITTKATAVTLDGQKLPPSAVGYTRDASGKWAATVAAAPGTLRKRPGLQGPIDDAFMTPFLVVTPSGTCADPAVEAWVQSELAHFQKRWREVFRGTLRMIKDTEVTQDDVKSFSLVLWGDVKSNSLIAKIFPLLPPLPGAGGFTGSSLPVMIHPNPLIPGRYVVINSGPTFREAHDKTNSLQNPKLPDWALLDLSSPPTAAAAGKVVKAGFFDEQWKVK